MAFEMGTCFRCGWLDIPLLRYTSMVNGYTAIALTKMDILDTLDEVKICVEYRKAGRPMTHFPSSEQDFDGVEVEYITLPGWKSPIVACKTFEELPKNAQEYVLTIERLLKVPGELWIHAVKVPLFFKDYRVFVKSACTLEPSRDGGYSSVCVGKN